MGYTISQAAARSGLSAYTLRYYDKLGLLPFVNRDHAGNRDFKESDFNWLAIITCLKKKRDAREKNQRISGFGYGRRRYIK